MGKNPGGLRRTLSRWSGQRRVLDETNVRGIYDKWASCYDITFGWITFWSRRAAAARVNALPGKKILEIGVGTGASLPLYNADKRVTGIDISMRMIEKAHARAGHLPHVDALEVRDAESMGFADDQFDIVVANHVLSVTPDPHRLCREIARVCRPGGDILIVNHFQSSSPALLWFEKVLDAYAGWIGWRADFDDACLDSGGFSILDRRRLRACPIFMLVHCRNPSNPVPQQLKKNAP